MSEVIIIRGLPGSGKTTYAKEKFPHHALIEADDYFCVGGLYIFDFGRIKDAHSWCLWRAQKAHEAGCDIVVANTFTRYWEMKEYLRLWPNARVIRMNYSFESAHGVPPEKIKQMAERFEGLAGEEWVGG